MLRRVDHVGDLAYEPMVLQHPDGALFVNGFGRDPDPDAVPQLWRSDDDGQSWQRLDVGDAADGATGNSDPDLAAAVDGTLYSIHLGWDSATQRGTHIAVGASQDLGESWTWTRLSEGYEEDRPWVGAAPGGVAHAIWNDNRGGVRHSVTRDYGSSWSDAVQIQEVGGSSHLAVGPSGELAVRVTPLSWGGYRFDEGVELILVSTDEGATWMQREAPGTRVWIADADRTPQTDLIDRWAEPLAWDDAGGLYSLWSEGRSVWLARSGDLGASWQSEKIVEGKRDLFYPYLDAGGEGELAALWLLGRSELATEELQIQVARIDWPAGTEPPEVRTAEPFEGDTWQGAEKQQRTVGGDYLPVALLNDGSLGAVTPIIDPAQERFGFTYWHFGLASSRESGSVGSESSGPED